jgi:phosphate uptake regulator
MDIRHVQKTGNMHYVYLPTSWCKRHSIDRNSTVSILVSDDGSLTVNPGAKEKKHTSIKLTLNEDNQDIIIKLIIACYINPATSFNIKFENKVDFGKLLDQKKVISALEFVELDGTTLTYESSISVNDPGSLLRTMSKKLSNMIGVMITEFNPELIQKYEEEIDRSKLMIDKSVTEALTFHEPLKQKTIDLHYIALISHEIERLADSLILLEKGDMVYIKQAQESVILIKDALENSSSLNYKEVVNITLTVLKVKPPSVKDIKSYLKTRIRVHLENICDTLLDWSILNEVKEE